MIVKETAGGYIEAGAMVGFGADGKVYQTTPHRAPYFDEEKGCWVFPDHFLDVDIESFRRAGFNDVNLPAERTSDS